MKKWMTGLAILGLVVGLAHRTSAETLSRLMALADSLSNVENSDSSIAVRLKALEVAQRQYGPADSTVAEILELIAVEHYYISQFSESEAYYARALKIREAVHGPNHPRTARCLTRLGVMQDELTKYDQAVASFERAIAIADANSATDPSELAFCLDNLAAAYRHTGDFERAANAAERAVSLYEEINGPDHLDVTYPLVGLASIYAEQGEYGKSVATFERAIRIRENAGADSDTDFAITLSNLADVYMRMGKLDQARDAFARSIKIKVEHLGEDSPSVAVSRNGLANVFLMQDMFDEAEPLVKKALTVFESILGPDDHRVGLILANLGTVYIGQHRYDEAEECLLKSLSIREKALGSDHPLVARTLFALSNLAADQGRFDEAIDYNLRALAIREKKMGKKHPEVALVHHNLAISYRRQGNFAAALAQGRRACEIRQFDLRENGRYLSEKDVLSYSGFLRGSVSNYLSCYLAGADHGPGARTPVVEALLRAKGQVSDEIFERQRSLASDLDADVQAVARSLQTHKRELAQMFVQGPDDIEDYQPRVETLSAKIAGEEDELARRSVGFRNWRETKEISLKRIQTLIPADACVIEYVRFDFSHYDPDRSVPTYVAVVVKRAGDPSIVNLGDADVIDRLVSDYRRHLRLASSFGTPTEADLADYKDIAGRLGAKVWDPVAQLASSSERLIICPDAALNLVSFAGLNDERGYIIENHSVQYLCSARDLIRLDQATPDAAGLLAMGDPDYDGAAVNTKSNSRGTVVATDPRRSYRGLPDCEGFWSTLVSPLPNTRREVETIAANWRATETEPVSVFLGIDADESAFKESAGGKRVIHLATHGYYIGSNCESDQATIVNPLLLTGLFFSGANQRRRNGPDGVEEDGVLTAFEVSGMHLEGCRLVVLSACETGLGTAEEGEGVYGLRRAFQMAGARTVVSALWEISDADAARVASQLYQKSSRGVIDRLRALQISEIETLRARHIPDHPVRWAAFVAQGD